MKAGIALLAFCSLLQAQTATTRLEAVEEKLHCRLGVAALDTANGRRVDYKPEERFAMCSTFKLLMAAAILTRVDRGLERLDRKVSFNATDLLEWAPVTRERVKDGRMSIAELCAASIEQSDNTAANLLLKSMGGPQGFTDYVRSLGDKITRLDRDEPTLNDASPGDARDTTSPRAMLESMQKVLLGSVLSPASRKLLEDWLSGVRNGAGRLRAGTPMTWRVSHKTGTGGQGNSTNDIAIAWPPGRAPILVCAYLTECKAPIAEREGALADVARIIASEFGHPGK
jgi:beta-lactamase class A